MSKILRCTTFAIIVVLLVTAGVVFFNFKPEAKAAESYISLSEVYVYGGAEWIEVYNASSSPIDINGYKIKGDGHLDSPEIINNNIVVPAGGIAIVKETDTLTNFDFENTGQTLIFQDPDGTEIERISYGGSTGLDANIEGKSLQKILGEWLVEPITKNAINKDVTAPVITINSYETGWTNQNITVIATSSDGTLNATTTTFTANSTFDFVAWDNSGNFSTTTVNITNIDKIAPNILISSPSGDVETSSSSYSISGTADSVISPVASIFLSFDNENTWQEVIGTSTWSISAQLSTSTLQNTILVKATDEAGNIATLTGSVITYIRPAVNNFSAGNVTANSIDLTWDTPAADGNDYTSFDIRRSNNAITEDNFYSATVCDKPDPIAGALQGIKISNLTSETTYYFAIKLHDYLASSTISTALASTLASALVDTVKPGDIDDLSYALGSTPTQIVLSWTATGDDGDAGIATKYTLRYRTDVSTINESNFSTANSIFNTLIPKVSGSSETFTISNLTPRLTYRFAVKAQDEAGNFSNNVSNTISATIPNNAPTVSSFSPSSGVNNSAVAISIAGTNFINGQNIIRFTNSDNTFDISGFYVSSAEVNAIIATGTPAGIYNIKIINSNGASNLSSETFEVISSSFPEVTNVSPAIGPNTENTNITIMGVNFTSATGAMLDDNLNTALTNFLVASSSAITATVPEGITAGEYNIKISSPAGENNVSSVRFTISAPTVINSSSVSNLNTSNIIDLGDTNIIPSEITLNNNYTATSSEPSGVSAEINVVISSNTAVTNSSNVAYTGNINPPRVVKADSSLPNLGIGAVVIKMGNPEEKLNFSNDFVATIILSSNSTPLIWYYNKTTGKYELAGKNGSKNGVAYSQGGTVLSQDGTRYTVGLLLNHMSTYAAGVKPAISSSAQTGVVGNSVTLSGSNFHPSITVKIGGTSATVTAVDSTNYDDLTFTIPSVSAATHDIIVQNPDGQSATLTNGLTVTRVCATSDVANSSVVSGDYPSCVATDCASGYTLSGGACTAIVNAGGGGGGSSDISYFPVNSTTNTAQTENAIDATPKIDAPIEVLGTKITADLNSFIAGEKKLLANIDKKLTARLSGNILLQVEEHGEAWYVDSASEQRYYLANGTVAYGALRKFGLGITDADLAKIPLGIEEKFEDLDTDGDGLADKLEEGLGTDINKNDTDGDGVSDYDEIIKNSTNPTGSGKISFNSSLVNRLKGKILLQVESRGEAWYLNPKDGKRYYMKDGGAAYQIMRFLSLGITNENIRKIDIGDL